MEPGGLAGLRVDRLQVSLQAMRKMTVLIVDRRVRPRAQRFVAWNKPLMASRKPLVWRDCAQATMPSRWRRTKTATSFIGSTLERMTQVHQWSRMLRATLICLRARISRNCSL
jgi:hypothetical protein